MSLHRRRDGEKRGGVMGERARRKEPEQEDPDGSTDINFPWGYWKANKKKSAVTKTLGKGGADRATDHDVSQRKPQ